jgi:hypothetical protein
MYQDTAVEYQGMRYGGDTISYLMDYSEVMVA